MAQRTTLQERNYAFARMYDERKEKLHWISALYNSYVESANLYEAGNTGVEEALWVLLKHLGESQKHYTEYMDGEKTHKGVLVKKDKEGKETRTDYHITAEGVYYKEWKEGDEPAFYMKDYLFTRRHYKLNKFGMPMLNDTYLNKMSKGKREKYVKMAEAKEANEACKKMWMTA